MMPTFSFLKHSRRDSQQLERNDGINVEPDSEEKAQRRQSKRTYLRSLLRRPSIFSESRSRRRESQLVTSQSSKLPSPAPAVEEQVPPTPMSDKNKPLPRPPPPGSEPAFPSKPTIKLERIISPIAPVDLYKLFSGAPQFFARSEGHHTGAPHPSVAFPWNLEVDIRDLSDHCHIHDEAWGSVTAWPHITLQTRRNPEALEVHHEKRRAHFLPRCRERPNMLSMQGSERGTIGYQAALELGVADALESADESVNGTQQSISEARREFLNGKDGLRPVTDTMLIDRLLAVSETYHEDPLKHKRPTVELYSQLFTQVLFPPTRVIDTEDPYSLQVQIEVLIDVLAAPHVWVDFSLVEWRIRLGQILWGSSSNPDPDEEIAVNNEIIQEPGTQKYWLLLQLLLSSELLLRLDAIASNIDQGLRAPKPAEIRRFDKVATMSVKWSMILARTWLENIRAEKVEPEVGERKPTGWLASLTGNASHTPPLVNDGLAILQFHGRHQARQLSGLVHFAQKLGWPDLDALTSKISMKRIDIVDSVENSPAGTPRSMATQNSTSYFAKRRPILRRGISSQKSFSAIIRPTGWLSNSYISGLVLPGEGMSHFLISTLLENDEAAIAKLGEEANLYGGFVYCERSFWSTSCVVGRVLAARKGAAECMGWVASDVIPRGPGESWVDIDIDFAEDPENPDKKHHKPRIWHKVAVEHDSNVIGGADDSSVLPGDFIVPSDESTQAPLAVKFESLDLFSAMESDEPTPVEERAPTEEMSLSSIQRYSAIIRFSVDSDGEEKKEFNIALNHDVHFVTAHPCVGSPHTDILKSPTSASFNQSTNLSTPSLSSSFTRGLAGHPLHKAYTYTKIPLSTLLTLPISTPFSSLISPPDTPDPTQATLHTTSSNIPKVLIIDCTDTSMITLPKYLSPSPGKREFGSDLEMLVRALCAERGWNALISRRGRGCLACGVREAGALGWRVMVRVA